MAKLTPEQIAEHAAKAGFQGQGLTIAVAVALAESSGNPNAHNTKSRDDSYGLWQINMYGRPQGPDRREKFDLASDSQLFDAATNAKAAFSISHQGKTWTDWATYTNGAYKSHLDEARKAANAVTAKDKEPGGRSKKDNKSEQRGDRKIVLDLSELRSLATQFKDFADRVQQTRRTITDIAADIEPARAKLPDQALATLLSNVFIASTAPTQLARVAERLDRQGHYAEKVRALAEKADGGDGKWSAADARRFVGSVGKEVDPFERAVRETLLHGTVVRTLRRMNSSEGSSTGPARGGTNGKLPPSRLSSVGDGEKLAKPAAAQFRKMDAAARAAGLDLKVNSGYRTTAEQERLHNDYLNGRGALAARPGTSTHGLGLSADINVTDPKVLAWLKKNAGRYGFVNDVPSESWHWTYKPH